MLSTIHFTRSSNWTGTREVKPPPFSKHTRKWWSSQWRGWAVSRLGDRTSWDGHEASHQFANTPSPSHDPKASNDNMAGPPLQPPLSLGFLPHRFPSPWNLSYKLGLHNKFIPVPITDFNSVWLTTFTSRSNWKLSSANQNWPYSHKNNTLWNLCNTRNFIHVNHLY